VGEIIVGLENGVLRLCSSTAFCRENENLHEKNILFDFPISFGSKSIYSLALLRAPVID